MTEEERVDIPAIGAPSTNTERRQSPTILAPAARVMDPGGHRRRIVGVLIAGGRLLNNAIARELADEDGIEAYGDRATIDEVEAATLELLPHVVLLGLDLGHDPLGVRTACTRLTEQLPTLAVVAVCEQDRPHDLLAFVQAGASSCHWGRSSPQSLARTAIGAHRRESSLSPGLARLLLDEYRRLADDGTASLAPTPTLTPTEDEVLQRLAGGETPDAIAARHHVTPRMIGLHAGYAVTKLHRTYRDDALFRTLR